MTIKQEIENLKAVNKDLSNILTLQNEQIASLNEKVDYLIEYQTGNWEIKNKKMIYYRINGDILEEYNLLNANGNPSNTSVFSRVRI